MAPGVEFSDLNWLAIGIAVVVNMVVGFIWYAPQLPTGKIWMRAHKMPADVKPTGAQMAQGMTLMLVGAFLMMFVLGHTYVAYEDATALDTEGNAYDLTLADGLTGAFFVWLGFFVPVLWGSVAWEGKPWSLFFVNASYYLVVLAIAGILLVTVPA